MKVLDLSPKPMRERLNLYDGTNLDLIKPTKKISSRNTTGHTGVARLPQNMFAAYIGYKGRNIQLGTYCTMEEAIKAREAGEIAYYRRAERDKIREDVEKMLKGMKIINFAKRANRKLRNEMAIRGKSGVLAFGNIPDVFLNKTIQVSANDDMSQIAIEMTKGFEKDCPMMRQDGKRTESKKITSKPLARILMDNGWKTKERYEYKIMENVIVVERKKQE